VTADADSVESTNRATLIQPGGTNVRKCTQQPGRWPEMRFGLRLMSERLKK
jgi:hypothetical protein